MDALNRTDWDKLGKYRSRKGPDYIAKYVVRFLFGLHEITPSRCKARNCRHGFYYDPMTFNATVTSADAVFVDSESPEKGDADGVDEVLSDACLPIMVDP
jgi:hypothetical protein